MNIEKELEIPLEKVSMTSLSGSKTGKEYSSDENTSRISNLGFNTDDIKTPSKDTCINLEENFKVLPGETLDKYIERWMESMKETLRNSFKATQDSQGATQDIYAYENQNEGEDGKEIGKEKEGEKEETEKKKEVENVQTKTTLANIVQEGNKKKKVKFCFLETYSANKEGIDIMIPRTVVQESCKRFSNTLLGFFLGNRLPFPPQLVDRYVGNVWKKFSLEKAMMNSSGFFYFKISSYDGLSYMTFLWCGIQMMVCRLLQQKLVKH